MPGRMLLIGIGIALGGCGRATAARQGKPESLPLALAGPCDLGCVIQGGREDESAAVKNDTLAHIDVSSWTTSCPCAKVSPARVRIDAGGTAYLRVEVDLHEEPQFQGNMRILVHGVDAVGREIASFAVPLTVIPAAAAPP